MDFIIYIIRTIIILLVTWAGIRILGKKTIAQMTAYELAGVLILSTVAAEPLVYKIPSKQTVGVFIIAIVVVLIGKIALSKKLYMLDTKPTLIIANGKIDKKALKKNKINLPFLLSLLRKKGYFKVSEVEFGILEPDGTLSVIPKSQNRPVIPKDLKISTDYEGLSVPLIIDGMVQKSNLKYATLDEEWLEKQLKKANVLSLNEVFFAELNTSGELYIDLHSDDLMVNEPDIF